MSSRPTKRRLSADTEGTDYEEGNTDRPPFRIIEESVSTRRFSIYLSEMIDSPEKYVDLLHTLRTAEEDDEVNIYLNCPGGDVGTGLQIVNGIRKCAADVTVHLEGFGYSMAALLFCACHSATVADHSLLMFHDYSSEPLGGKGNEQKAEIMMATTWFARLMKDLCSPFLTDAEITSICDGKDIWIDAEDIRRRLVLVEEHRKSIKAGKRQARAGKNARA
ncbi:Clp protease ClpP [Paraburkholderia sp. UCT31]|uniref:ATP-dependent Clp protease proteolytic subunit n=1 Tax=Paraburkholderia sp. UCT31 TaxID=2615209 RepID=UPI0016553B3B|nr:ATP-dependent Clp protease proteolytic subunit [Paraburkholderia sp. UCT31]MBC8741869.1 Clp protease ClpP [Paraburkholderia sp. UCT31]